MNMTNLSERQLIDCVVDGELSETDLQAVLGSIADRPDGWKQLALAYLEAQTWSTLFRNSLAGVGAGAIAPSVKKPKSPSRPSVSTPAGSDRKGSRLYVMTLAAGLTAMFAVGLFSGHQWKESRAITGRYVLADPSISGSQRFAGDVTRQDLQTGRLVCDSVTVDPLTTGGPMQDLALPIIPVSRSELRSYVDQGPVLGLELRTRLQQLGYVVYEERRIYPVVLEDGRQVFIPVNNVRVQFVGEKVYQ